MPKISRSRGFKVSNYTFKMYKQAFQKEKSDTKFAVHLQYTICSSAYITHFKICSILKKNFCRMRYTQITDFYPTKRATKGYATAWDNWLYRSPAKRSRH